MKKDIHITLRPVGLHDAKVLFAWRNDEETRRQSKTNAYVAWEGHMSWLESSLKNAKRILCIAEVDGRPVGIVRAYERDDGYSEVSYTVAPESRGKGLSRPMVLAFVKECLPGRAIVADIKKGHAPSESVAKALGLLPHHETPSENPDDPRPMIEWR